MIARRFSPGQAGAALLCLAALLPGLAVRAAQTSRRTALLVGIDRYPCVPEPGLQLRGARTDLEYTRLALRYCGFEVSTLSGAQANGAAIRQGLGALAGRARPGDQIVFYFSGRGSVAYDPARPNQTEGLEPTLVPYDGRAGSAQADLRMSVLEKWAQTLAGKGASATILLDTCFTSLTARGEERFYLNVPRCVKRPGRPRRLPYAGPGVFVLAAAGTGGRAYEWRLDINADRWSGAFTYQWTNLAIQRLRAGKRPSFAELMGEVRQFFAARPGYMPGMGPYPPAERMQAAYRQPMFPAPPPPPQIAKEAEQVDNARKKQERELRVALATPSGLWSPQERRDYLAPLTKPTREYLERNLPGVALLPDYADRPDRVLKVERSGDAFTVAVEGDEIDADRKPSFGGTAIAEVMAEGLADYLQRQALVLRLFRMTEAPADQTLEVTWSVRSDKAQYHREDPFKFVGETPVDGFFYFVDQDEKDGVVQLIWPLRKNWDTQRKAGKLFVPGGRIPRDQEVFGHTRTRAILVVPSPSLSLPALKPPQGGQWTEDRAYGKAELAHLRALLEALERKQARWAAVTFDYEVLE